MKGPALRFGAAVVVTALLAACEGAGGNAPTAERSPASSRSPRPSASVGSGIAAGEVRDDLAGFRSQRLSWSPCGGDFLCARVRVPVDYSHPRAETIELSVLRRPAASSARIGSLVLNPGGPGGSGVAYARSARAVSPAVRARFDIVGFDPRGVGDSAPIECLDDREIDAFLALDGSPDDEAEERRLVQASRRLARRCGERSPDLVAHVGTRDTVRDLDVLRAVLGDERLYYLGKSYGTYLGALYADLFPTRVGRLVLDGAFDPATTTADVARTQATGFEAALAAFVEDCLHQASCPLPAPRSAALRSVDRLLATADRRALRSRQRRPVTQALVILGLAAGLYDAASGWPALRTGLAQALRGDGSTLLALTDAYTDRDVDGRYRGNSNAAAYAVGCLDRPERRTVAEIRAAASALAGSSPRFGSFLTWSSLPCAFWPVPAQGVPGAVRAEKAPAILVVGSLGDPATPFVWAQRLAAELSSGVLLSYRGDGHTAYRRGSDCIDRAVDRYLLDGGTPIPGTLCR